MAFNNWRYSNNGSVTTKNSKPTSFSRVACDAFSMVLIMDRQKLVFIFLLAASGYPNFANGTERKLAPAPPVIEPIDQTHMMRHVRRVLKRSLRQEQSEASIYIPPSLQ